MPGSIDNELFRKLLFSFPGKAIELLYDRYYKGLLIISESFTHNRNASEDIVQETFVHVWERHQWLGQYHDKSIQHYLVRVVKNKSITFYKRSLRLNEYKSRYLNGKSGEVVYNSIEVQLTELETYQEIHRIIATFPRREKECLLMKVEQDMTTDQIAQELMVTRKAVERSLTSANKRLKRIWSTKRL